MKGFPVKLQAVKFVDLPTPSGPMRTHLFRSAVDASVPSVILFSEIYQMTGPIARTAAMIAGQGYLVAVPEVYHEYAEPGEAFSYDSIGTDRGNSLKTTKSVAAFDADARAVVDYLIQADGCNKLISAIGICLGGHLAFRAAMNKEVKSAICLYATDLHKHSLGAGMCDDSLRRVGEITGELMMIWGRQDPHIPENGRRLIYEVLQSAGSDFTWHEFNGEHAFMRDEGPRYNPAIASIVYSMIFELLGRTLR